MTTRMVVTLELKERSALIKLAEMELRSPRDQIRVILRAALYRRGLLRSKYEDESKYSDGENDSIHARASSGEIQNS